MPGQGATKKGRAGGGAGEFFGRMDSVEGLGEEDSERTVFPWAVTPTSERKGGGK